MDRQILWSAVVGDASGDAEEARNFIMALNDNGVYVVVDPLGVDTTSKPLGKDPASPLAGMAERPLRKPILHGGHYPWSDFAAHPRAEHIIWRSTVETGSLPA